jgi:hypothetical protein
LVVRNGTNDFIEDRYARLGKIEFACVNSIATCCSNVGIKQPLRFRSRLIWVLATVFSFGAGIIVYLLAWIIMPRKH